MNFEFPEGATPIQDASDLLLPWVQTRSDLNRAEAENISDAQRRFLRASDKNVSTWFHFKEFQNIHRIMFEKVWAWAGKRRKSTTSIGVAPGLILMHIAAFSKEVHSWSIEPVELTFLEKSARIHHRLVAIHPFENGNGRFSRLIADRYLLCWKCSHPIWPDNLYNDGMARKQYILSLQAADKGDYEPLISLMKSFGGSDPSINTLFQENFYRISILEEKGFAKVKALLRSGQDPNHIAPNGQRSLQLIIKAKLKSHKKLELVKLLVEKGADVDTKDKSGLTPFQVAVNIGDKDIALFLRSKGARPIAPPGVGYTKYYTLFPQLPPV